jgi:hypothetical protein
LRKKVLEGEVSEEEAALMLNGKSPMDAQGKIPAMWPTPRTCSAMASEITPQRAQDKFPNLEREVARTMWPTPTTRDYKGGRKPDTLEASGRGVTNSLNDALTIRDQHGALNPEWVEWLMGFPAGHTNLESE